GLDVRSITVSPDGKTAVLVGSEGGGSRLYSWSLDPKDPGNRRELAASAGSDVQFTSDGRRLFYVRAGRIRVLDLKSRNDSTVDVTARVDVDFEADKGAAFEQAWYELRDGFFDPDMHGADWDGVRRTFEPRIAAARTPDELSRLVNLMLGELNASHLGHRGGRGGGEDDPPATGELGLRFDRLAYEEDGVFRVAEVLPLGPADVSDSVHVGDRLVSVDGVDLDGSSDLAALLEGTVGRKVTLGVTDPDGRTERSVGLKPIGRSQAGQLRYRAWVESRRAYVDSASGGRLGYVHIPDMGTRSLDQLYLDLDARNQEREGVVVDVRDNNGGFVNVYAIDVFTRPNYFTMRNRGGLPMPSRFQLGQRALLTPTVLVTNQHTLSDGEDFTEGYRTLGLGPVVGEPTAGWIIYTGSVGLVDGTSIRMPRTEIRGSDGEVMEMNPRPVDVEVVAPAGEWYAGTDVQLDAAVRTLLDRLDRRATDGGSR
ncbi:MAG TPA: S41 family peptidase, partial [Longimicrobiales bacterium]|nr:S41 family peptidase [Longimicrobiales bacterium]